MRLAIVDTMLMQPPIGGGQTFLVDLGPSLIRNGWEVHVVTVEGPDRSAASRLVRGGVALQEALWAPRHLPEERAQRLAAWVAKVRVQALAVSFSADAGWLALPLIDPSVGTLALVHTDGPSAYLPLTHYAPFVDRAVGVSEETHRRIVSECGIPSARARRIPYGATRLPEEAVRERWECPLPTGRLRIGYVGRVVQSLKRVLDIVPLSRELARRQLGFEMHVIGTGQELSHLQSEVHASGLGSFVRFWGWLSPEEVRARLLELDALVLFSEVEGLPLALLEAIGHAVVPVVTRTASGNAEVVRDGENGYLVPIGDIGAFADRLSSLAGNGQELARLRRAAWETSERYSVDNMTRQYERCLKEAVFGGNDGARAPRPAGPYPLLPSCRSEYPRWLRRVKWWLVGPQSLR
jgi:glycosyltransferase involved in cell wall biosynthesis